MQTQGSPSTLGRAWSGHPRAAGDPRCTAGNGRLRLLWVYPLCDREHRPYAGSRLRSVKVISHSCCVISRPTEMKVPRQMFKKILMPDCQITSTTRSSMSSLKSEKRRATLGSRLLMKKNDVVSAPRGK